MWMLIATLFITGVGNVEGRWEPVQTLEQCWSLAERIAEQNHNLRPANFSCVYVRK